MANTFKKIQTVTVGSGGAASIDFTSIPQTYTDLKIVMSLRSTGTGVSTRYAAVSFNSNTSNYTYRRLYGNGSGTGSDNGSLRIIGTIPGSTVTASVFGSIELYVPNYTSANNKSYSCDSVEENNATGAEQDMIAGLWSNTAAITSVTLTSDVGNFAEYSTATLYGVSNVPVAEGAKATGGIITADNNYIYHTFLSSGTFTPTQSLTCDYLVVAGGGAGGYNAGGGGGAGGFRYLTSKSLTSGTSYTATVGAGGAGGGAAGASGSNSTFNSDSASGGGGGGTTIAQGSTAGVNGGSGGGARANSSASGGTGNAGSYSPVEGFAGGATGGSSTFNVGGGGGGAGAVGGTGGGATNPSGAGGDGLSNSITGSSVNYAGGGGGGTNGVYASSAANNFGGGRGGGNTNSATSGTVNTGGGGGGGYDSANGASGGSGIVIVRYAR